MSDINKPSRAVLENGPFLFCDVLDQQALRELVVNYEVTIKLRILDIVFSMDMVVNYEVKIFINVLLINVLVWK